MMNNLFLDMLDKGVVVFLDDILIYSTIAEELIYSTIAEEHFEIL